MKGNTDYFLGSISDIGNLAEVGLVNFHFKYFKEVYFDSPFKDLDIDPSRDPIKKEWYLMGVEMETSTSGDYSFSNPEILISLVNLGKKIKTSNGLFDNNGQIDELSLLEDVKDWCNKYGLPYHEKYFEENYGKDKKLSDYNGFRIWEFKSLVARLYDYFNLWYGLAYDDIRRVIEYSKNFIPIDLKKDLDEQISILKKCLGYRIWENMKTEISIRYNDKTDSYEIAPCTDSLIAIAYFQLAILMANKDSTSSVKFCSMCHRLFKMEHGNAKICSDCKRDYHAQKTRESRARNKKKK